MTVNFGDAPPQRELGVIPDGTFVRLHLHLKEGGTTIKGLEADGPLFKAAKTGDVCMLECEFTVLGGEYDRKKIFQSFTITGGQVDEKGISKGWNISKSTLRAILESVLGISSKDESPAAKARLQVPGFRAFNNLEPIIARLGIESDPKGVYPDKNKIMHVVTPDEPEWQVMRSGGQADPKPIGAQKTRATAPAAAAAGVPAWQAPNAIQTGHGGVSQQPWNAQPTGGGAAVAPGQPAGPSWLQR